jgi:hypothetical protein
MNGKAWFYGPLGFGSTRGSFPTAETVRKTDQAMARTEKGLCPSCGEPVNEDGKCLREECR